MADSQHYLDPRGIIRFPIQSISREEFESNQSASPPLHDSALPSTTIPPHLPSQNSSITMSKTNIATPSPAFDNIQNRTPPSSTSSANNNNGKPKTRVLVIGAGAAGMACAEQLSQHQEKFDVTVIEAQGYAGGQAFSIPIDEEKYGSKWMNQGVQG